MPRTYRLPTTALLFTASLMLLLVSISLPRIPALDFVRVYFESFDSFGSGGSNAGGGGSAGMDGALAQLRFGIWGYCYYTTAGVRTCIEGGHSYSATVYNSDKTSWQTTVPSMTRGLAAHTAAAGLAAFALLLSLLPLLLSPFISSLSSPLSPLSSALSFSLAFSCLCAAIVTLISFGLDVALLIGVRNTMGRLHGVRERVGLGPGIWTVFASFVLLCVAGGIVWVGRRRERERRLSAGQGYGYGYGLGNSKVAWRERFRRLA